MTPMLETGNEDVSRDCYDFGKILVAMPNSYNVILLDFLSKNGTLFRNEN